MIIIVIVLNPIIQQLAKSNNEPININDNQMTIYDNNNNNIKIIMIVVIIVAVLKSPRGLWPPELRTVAAGITQYIYCFWSDLEAYNS